MKSQQRNGLRHCVGKPLYILLSLLCFYSLAAHAVRAGGSWVTVRQSDGTQMEVRLCGDEWLHYFVTRDGVPLMADEHSGDLCYADVFGFGMKSSGITAHEAASRTAAEQLHVHTLADVDAVAPYTDARRLRQAPRQAALQPTHHIGKFRGLVVLASFPDQPFHSNTPVADFSAMLNDEGYNGNRRAKGSVRDYFLAQSNGLFDLSFDVAGPIMVSDSCHNYVNSSTVREKLVPQVLKAIADTTDFSPYDWDDDGEVDQVLIIYAGYGGHEYYENEATAKAKDCIWPHEWELSTALKLNNKKIYTYAVINELAVRDDSYSGIGTICHEFSHCLGLPDMYDTRFDTSDSSTGGLMDAWELMDGGNYNNRGWCPPNYSAFERAYCGWITPTVLTTDTMVYDMPALAHNSNVAYKIVNDCDKASVDEYYLLENRQKQGWDSYVPGHGLLVWHIDYSRAFWKNNLVNNDIEHLRCMAICADNEPLRYYHTTESMSHVTFPYITSTMTVDALTDTTTPAATVFNTNVRGTNFMGKPIAHITESADSLISFHFYGIAPAGIQPVAADATRQQPAAVYTLDGRVAGTGNAHHSKQLYIVRDRNGNVRKMSK